VGIVADLDRFQRSRPLVGFPLAVAYKFFDDKGNYLAATLTYYAFIAIFPLLLIASSVLGFLIQGDPQLEQTLLNSALSQFPIVGDQLGRPGGLSGSASAIAIGTLTALYGVTGLGQAGQHTMQVVWSIPYNARPNPFLARLRSLGLLSLAGIALLAISVLSTLASSLDSILPQIDPLLRWAVRLVAIGLNALVLAVLFRWTTTTRPPLRSMLPGALVVALFWQALQLTGAAYVGQVVARASSMNGVFALVLGLVVLLYLTSVAAVIGGEVNVVLLHRLYPRALLTPFTDDVRLTTADRRVYQGVAEAQVRKGFERVEVHFDEEPEEQDTEPFAAESPQGVAGSPQGAAGSPQGAAGSPQGADQPEAPEPTGEGR
jgi:membrane protein